jgi:hypothetical protein
MKSQRPLPRLLVWFIRAIVFVIALTILHIFFAPMGYFAVRAACSEAGGVHVYQPQDVDGYWHGGYDGREGESYPDCPHCVEQVARGFFSYVDFESRGISQKLPTGFLRFQLAETGDDACVEGISRFQPPPSGKCVAVIRLPAAPTSDFKYTSTLTRNRRWFGVPIRERNRSVVDVRANQIVAVAREFDYPTPWEEFGKYATRYRCERNSSKPINEETLVLSALRAKLRQ